MTVDWDDVLHEASNAPGQILEDCLDRIEEVREIILIWVDFGGELHFDVNTASLGATLAMLELTKHQALHEMLDKA